MYSIEDPVGGKPHSGGAAQTSVQMMIPVAYLPDVKQFRQPVAAGVGSLGQNDLRTQPSGSSQLSLSVMFNRAIRQQPPESTIYDPGSDRACSWVFNAAGVWL